MINMQSAFLIVSKVRRNNFKSVSLIEISSSVSFSICFHFRNRVTMKSKLEFFFLVSVGKTTDYSTRVNLCFPDNNLNHNIAPSFI